jgi:hypothetical protein
MKTSDVYSSKASLKAADLGTSRAKVVIDGAELVKFDDGEKIVLAFRGKEKTLVLNKTNAGTIEEMLGSDDTDDWMGRSIVLYVTKVDFQGKRVPAIRVSDNPRDYPKAETQRRPAERKSEPGPEPPAEDFQAEDDDVPF